MIKNLFLNDDTKIIIRGESQLVVYQIKGNTS